MLKLTNVKKSYGGVKALQGINLEVAEGEIHAILGENGAGKSTLMKAISGAIELDEGIIEFYDKELKNNNPHLAKEHGINIIYQEFSLIPDLTVAENIYFGSLKKSWIDWKSLFNDAQALMTSLGFDIDVRKKVSELSIAQQQMIEISKAMSGAVKLLILDEPSAVLGPEEVKRLFVLLKKLKDQGIGIIYISHHLEELIELTDKVTILKDGRTIQTVYTNDVNKDILVNMMIGREMTQMYPNKSVDNTFGTPLKISNLKSKRFVNPIDFEVLKGEILGIGGLVGAGRSEILQSLFGYLPIETGEIIVNDEVLKPKEIELMIKKGWGMVSEDRKNVGGVMSRSIKENISITNYDKVANRFGFIDLKSEESIATSLVERLKIKIGNLNDNLSSLSGGNQQKVVLAKWLNLDLKVLLIDEPTRGVDVGARYEIYQILQDLADEGVYIIMVSSDIDELMGVSDRIMVMNSGRIQGVISKEEFSEELILRMAIGAN